MFLAPNLVAVICFNVNIFCFLVFTGTNEILEGKQ
jgi:hypothetical protein